MAKTTKVKKQPKRVQRSKANAPARTREEARNRPYLLNFGLSGTRWNGRTKVGGEYIPELRGQRRQRTFTKMLRAPQLGAPSLLFRALASKPEYTNKPAYEGDQESEELAQRFNEILEDMKVGMKQVAAGAVTANDRGFWIGEVVLKIRRGQDVLFGQLQSKFSDGFWGVHKIESRSQDSVSDWDMDAQLREPIGFWQDVPGAGRAYVPMWKCLHVVPWADNGSPEGNGGALLTAYDPWWMTKDLEETEKIGAERHAAGLPILRVPERYFTGSTDEDNEMMSLFEKIVSRVRMDETAGLVIPGKFDKNGNETPWDFELASSSKNTAENDLVIKRKHAEMLLAYLCGFLGLGQNSNGGSFSLSSDLTDLVTQVIGSILDLFVSEIQTKLWPLLARLNGWNLAKIPTLVHTDIERQDAAKFATAVSALLSSGALPASPSVARFITEELGWDLDLDADVGMMLPQVSTAPAAPVEEEKAEAPQFTAAQLANFMTMRELRGKLGCGSAQIMSLARAGKFPAYPLGRSYRFDPKDIAAYLKPATF